MSLEYGIPILLTLGAFWILIRMETKRPDVLPPPSKDVERSNDAGWWT